MEVVLFAIPFIVAIFLLIFYRSKMVWWEYVLVIIPTILFVLTIRGIVASVKMADTEYLGGYITKIRHYDEWDEWVTETCTEEVPDGVDEDGNTIYKTVEYDCSHREYHSQYWVFYSTLDRGEVIINRKLFDEIKNRFNSPMVFVDMHRDYYRIDGDAQDYYWKGTKSTIRTITKSHKYKNKVQNSNSIFNFKKIRKKEAKNLGLFEYPDIVDYDQSPVMNTSSYNVTKSDIDAVKYINGYYGAKKQIRVFVILFKDTDDIEKAFQQQSYWKGGNKNELVICFGIDDKRIPRWCYAFSWEDTQKLAISIMDRYRDGKALDIPDCMEWLGKNLNLWKRKEFKDFDYVKVSTDSTTDTVSIIISIVLSVVLALIMIKNNYKNK